MKKFLSSILAFVLVLSLMPVSTTFAVASDQFFQLRFDDLTDLTAAEARRRVVQSGTVALSSDDYRGDSGKAFYAPAAVKSYSRIMFYGHKDVVTPNVGDVYEMSAWYKLTAPDDVETGTVRFGADDNETKESGIAFANNSKKEATAPKGEWVKLISSYTVKEPEYGVTPKIISGSSKTLSYYIDDIVVAPKYRSFFDDVSDVAVSATKVVDGGTGALDETVNHIAEYGLTAKGQSILHSGRTALNSKLVSTLITNVDSTKGKAYSLWAWVKINEASEVNSGKVVLAVMDNEKAAKYTTSEEFEVNKDGWTKLSLDYVMPEAGGDVIAPTELCVMQKSGDIITDLNIDDITIVPIGTKAIFDTDEFVPENISVTGGAAFDISTDYYNRASGRSLVASGRTGLEDMISLNNPLSDDEYEYQKPYTFKVSVMSPTAGTVVPFAVLDSGVVFGDEVALGNHLWKDAELTFLATSKPTSIGVMQKTGTVLSTIYVDDISITQSKNLDEKYVINTSVDDLGNVNVSGKLIPEMAGYPITVKVLKAGKTIDKKDDETAILDKDIAVVVDYDGTYSVTLEKCTETLDVNSELLVVVDGLIYPVTSFLYDKINYTNPIAEERILANVNSATTGSGLKEILTSGSVYDDIGLSAIELPEIVNVDFIYDYVVGLGVDFADSVELAAAYEMGWMVGYLNESIDTETMAELIYANEEKLGFSEEKTYEKVFDLLDDEAKIQIIDKITTAPAVNGIKFENEAAVVKFILDETVMFKVDEAINYVAKMETLIQNAEYLGVDFSDYEELKSAGKKYVNERLVEDVESAADFADIQELLDGYIEDYKKEAKKEENRGGGGGSSSGGGNRYANTTVAVPSTTPAIPQSGNAGTGAQGGIGGKFKDIAENHWAGDAIAKLSEKNVINGYEDGSFKPENKVTRAEYVKMIVTLFNLVDNNATSNFGDVSKNDWSYKYIASAEKLGIISGGGSGEFNPNGEITREDLVTISYRLFNALGLELSQINEKVYFADRTEISAYAEEAAIALQRAGIVNGVTTEIADKFNFNPKHSASRAECAKILAGLLGYDW